MRGPGKGKTNNPFGRPKGVRNKATIAANELLDRVMDKLGGEKWLHEFAINNPVEFVKLWGKKIRQEVEVSGPGGGPIRTHIEVSFIGSYHKVEG